jgi:hypothetical protein
MNCPATGRSHIDRVERLGRLRAGRPPLASFGSVSEPTLSVPRSSRDFYFEFPRNQAGNAVSVAGLTLLSRSFL